MAIDFCHGCHRRVQVVGPPSIGASIAPTNPNRLTTPSGLVESTLQVGRTLYLIEEQNKLSSGQCTPITQAIFGPLMSRFALQQRLMVTGHV
jgi:hypothetical protein